VKLCVLAIPDTRRPIASRGYQSGGRRRGASPGVDRRAQLAEVDHIHDHHGLVLVAESTLWSCAPSAVAPRVGAACRAPGVRPRAERQAGAPSSPWRRPHHPTARRRRRRALDPIKPNSAVTIKASTHVSLEKAEQNTLTGSHSNHGLFQMNSMEKK
jgi:hypothetical protein